MPQPFGRVLSFVLPLAALLALQACGAEDRAQMRSELFAASRANREMGAAVATLSTQGAKDRELLLEYRKRAEESETLRTKVADLEKEREAAKKESDLVALHRDELKDWIEADLLPLAEVHDPRLANLRDAATDMAAEVERVRGLKFKRPFMRRLITRAQVGEWMRRDMKREMPEDEVRKITEVGAEFGLLEPGTNLYDVFAEFLEAGAAAFYRSETGTFYHVEGNDGRGARPVVFHELVHALEDQHFGITDFYNAIEDDSDASLARRAVVEGSACHFASKYEAANPGDVEAMNASQSTPEMFEKMKGMLANVPPFLVASYGLYPYKNAPGWLAAIGADTPEQFAALYADPPVSTEQVLHPAKFPLTGPRDYPHVVSAPDLKEILGAGHESVAEDNMGELTTGLMLMQIAVSRYPDAYAGFVDAKTESVKFLGSVKKAIEGWDGDRFAAWRETSTGAVTIVWTTVWDSEADAREFHDIYADLLGKRLTGKKVTPRPSPARFTNPKSERISGMNVWGNRVVVVLGATPDKAEALFAAGAGAKVTADPRDAND